MRILHVITMLELGGAQRNTLHTCRRLAERGHDVILAAGPGGLLDAEASQGPQRFVPLPHLVRPISPWRDLRALLSLVSLVRSLRPDVVHTHSSKAGALGRLAGRLGGARVVVHTVHGWSFSEHHGALESRAYRIIEKLSSYLCDWVVSVSRTDLDNGLEHGLVAKGRGSVIRSGIDIGRFSTSSSRVLELRSEWGAGPSDVLVVNASCLKPQKAPLDFVAAAAQAAREEDSLRFVLVGDGELRGDVERAVAKAGLAERFRLVGWRSDMPDVLAAADIVGLTSLWEGLPRTVVEARACGRPVVATAVNGTPEAIREGVQGHLVKPHDVLAFAAALVRLARDPGQRRRMGEAGRQGLEEFDQEHMVDEQERLYERLLAEKAS